MQPSSTPRARLLVGIAVSVVLGLAGAAVYVVSSAPGARASIALSIVEDPATGTFGYSPEVVQIPRAEQVDITITNWDPMPHSVSGRYMNVSGTMAEMMVHMGNGMMGRLSGPMVGALPPDLVSHTFTMVAGGYDLNIPIPVAPNAGTPSVVSFTLLMDLPGTFSWSCMAEETSAHGPMVGGLTIG
jgi:hypothetical protein